MRRSTIQTTFIRLWHRYCRYIKATMGISEYPTEMNVSNWRDVSFVGLVIYLIPFSFLAIVPKIILGLMESQTYTAFFELSFYLLLCFLLLQKSIGVRLKKRFLMAMLYIFSLFILLMQGSAGPGILYFTCICTFTVFLFKSNRIYYFLLLNLGIVLAIDLIIYKQLFPTPLISQFSAVSWLSYASNLLFINLFTLILIQRVIWRLEKFIHTESELQGQLADETLEIVSLHNQLKESEDYYRYLFASNPSPMWVFDNHSLDFLQVNDAALKLYGYSREEFMRLNVKDIRPESELKTVLELIRSYNKSNRTFKGNMLHIKKNKKTFHVDVRSNQIEINGRSARLVLATDVTERVKYITSIENQNNRLKHIAWIQSHKVRAPLARVMSLSNLLTVIEDEKEKEEVLNYLIISADELNGIITSIIKHAEQE